MPTCEAASWLQIFQGLTPALIALFVALIAYRQWKTAHNKLRLDLYDRRYKVYFAARQLLSMTEDRNEIEKESYRNLLLEIDAGLFFFPGEVRQELGKILMMGNVRMGIKGDEAAPIHNLEVVDKPTAGSLMDVFRPHLDLSQI